MQATTRRSQAVTIADLSGNIVAGPDAVALRDLVGRLLSGGGCQIILNLDGIRMIDSSGLGEIVRARDAASAAGATIKLLHVGAGVRQVLERAQVANTFQIFDDESAAVASFR